MREKKKEVEGRKKMWLKTHLLSSRTNLLKEHNDTR